MADTVYQQLERMLPALEDLQVKGIFTEAEVRAIVQKRRDFEFLLRRRIARKADFLRYIEYELNLEELRKLRKAKAGKKAAKTTISDYAGVQQIHIIFDRALMKFRGDLMLWLQYLDYCHETQSNKRHSRALATALQLFPREAGLWIRAAYYEFVENCNPTSARVLMQRGLRINGAESPLLWIQYFRMELLYVEKLKGRRDLLGIEGGGGGGGAVGSSKGGSDGTDNETGSSPVEVPLLQEEQTQGPVDPYARSVKQFFEGAVPLVVYSSALQQLGDKADLDVRMRFVDVCGDFAPDTAEQVVKEIVASIERDLGPEDAAWARAMVALKGLASGAVAGVDTLGAASGGKGLTDDADSMAQSTATDASGGRKTKRRRKSQSGTEDAATVATTTTTIATGFLSTMAGLERSEKACVDVLESVVRVIPTKKMWSYVVKALVEVVGADPRVVAEARRRAEEVTGPLGSAVEYAEWADALEDDSEARVVLERGLSAYSTDVGLWRRAMQRAAGAADAKALLDRALKVLDPSREGACQDFAGVWVAYLERLISDERTARGRRGTSASDAEAVDEADEEGDEEGDEEIESRSNTVRKAFESAVVMCRGEGRACVCETWYTWEGRKGLLSALRLVGKEEEALIPLCERAVEDVGSEQGVGEVVVRGLFEAVLAVCGRCDSAGALWEGYEDFERKLGNHKKANGIRWRREHIHEA